MIVRNVLPNLVERLQMMNPKIFIDLYDDGLQAKEIVNEKNNTKNIGGKITKPRAQNKKTLVDLQVPM